MEPAYENKQTFFAQHCRSCPSPVIALLDAGRIANEVRQHGLAALLNGLLGLAVPTDEQAARLSLFEEAYYVRRNLQCAIAKLSLLEPVPAVVEMLGDALFALSRDAAENHFAPPERGVAFDFAAHDRALRSFRQLLTQWAGLLAACQASEEEKAVAHVILLCYGRALFDLRCFQAPPRTTAEEAARDARGESNLWGECLEAWGLA